jgi:hypothetical protein
MAGFLFVGQRLTNNPSANYPATSLFGLSGDFRHGRQQQDPIP